MADGTAEGPPPGRSRRLIGELRVARGPDAGRMFAVPDEAVIGREEGVDIVLTDTQGELSRRHARLILREGTVMVEDLGSLNATFVNDERLNEPRALEPGDRIRVGTSTLEFTAADSALAAEPQVTRARAIPTDLTRAREIPADLTQARETPTDLTHARETPTDLTHAREIPTDLTQAREVPGSQLIRARPTALPELDPTFAPPGADGQLRILSGPGTGAATAIVGGSATIGREPECDLQVLDSEVSRRHAKVSIRDGMATLDDLRSANGTYVDGERILTSYRLAPGDRVQIGEATIEVTAPVFAGAVSRPLAPQVTGVRDVLTEPAKLLGAESADRKWWTLAVVCAAVFMLLLDVTIVAVALPTISRSLHPTFSQLQWIVDGYTLGLTAVLLTAGSFADIFGRKKVLSIGLIVFTLASVACAQATSATMLDISRVIQGIGGATMFACSLALIVQEFPAGERAVAFGIYGAVNGLSVALGPIAGGLLVQGIGWQSIFYLNVPIAIFCFVLLQRKVVNLPGPSTTIDWPGLVLFSTAMFLLTYATIRGNDDGWTSATILGCYIGAVVLLIIFVFVERRRQHPMFDLTLFRNPTFVGSSVSAITACFSVLALIFFLTTWMQSVLGYSPIGTGLRMLTFTGVSLLVAPGAGRATATVSPRIVLTAGLAIIAVGTFTMTAISATSSWLAILPGLCLIGVGLGIINPTLASTAVSVVPPWRGGMASGMNSTAREAGTTAGIAVLGTVLQHQVLTHVHSSLMHTTAATKATTIATAISVGGTPQLLSQTPAALRPTLQHTARSAYAAGLNDVFIVATVVALVGCITAFSTVRKKHLRADATGAAGH
jgi:EmrB/QacA subfamily drug resistance transporter